MRARSPSELFVQNETASVQSPWLELAAAIVKEAASQYSFVLCNLWEPEDLRKRQKEKRDEYRMSKPELLVLKMEIEEFFHSEWYEFLTEINPERLIYQCRLNAKEIYKKDIIQDNKKRIKKLMKDII